MNLGRITQQVPRKFVFNDYRLNHGICSAICIIVTIRIYKPPNQPFHKIFKSCLLWFSLDWYTRSAADTNVFFTCRVMPIRSANMAVITIKSDFRLKRNRHYKIFIRETKGCIQEESFPIHALERYFEQWCKLLTRHFSVSWMEGRDKKKSTLKLKKSLNSPKKSLRCKNKMMKAFF